MANMLTCLSGFVDQGESVEEAVAREIQEEAGLKLTKVEVLGSQPWPIGALARGAGQVYFYWHIVFMSLFGVIWDIESCNYMPALATYTINSMMASSGAQHTVCLQAAEAPASSCWAASPRQRSPAWTLTRARWTWCSGSRDRVRQQVESWH